MAKILIADDCKLTRMIVRDALEINGHQVIEAQNGLDCIERTDGYKPDVLILDVHMPQINGLEVVTELRVTNKKLKIIGITSLGNGPYLMKMREFGANRVLPKPFTSEQIQKVVEDLLLDIAPY